jgi:hypothetical protein
MIEHQPEPSRIDPESYRGYAGLPPLVGLHSMSEAVTKRDHRCGKRGQAAAYSLVSQAAPLDLR